jgi:hypothetical protein
MVDTSEKNTGVERIIEPDFVCETFAIGFTEDVGVEDWCREAEAGNVGYDENAEGERGGADEV